MCGRLTRIPGIIVCLLHVFVGESSSVTTPGWPACYISKSYNQNVNGLYKQCYSSTLSYPGLSNDISIFYSYCSPDHECCRHNGYPACCRDNDLNQREIAGLVIGCVVFVAVIFGISLYLSKRFCSKDDTD